MGSIGDSGDVRCSITQEQDGLGFNKGCTRVLQGGLGFWVCDLRAPIRQPQGGFGFV